MTLFKTVSNRAVHSALVLTLALGFSSSAKAAKTTYMVTMADGTRLATDVHLPPGPAKKWPLILVRTPYNRESMANAMMPFAAGKPFGVVFQDQRGRYGSEGINTAFMEDTQDGYDTVEWLAQQPFSNGKVGTAGISAMGITQYLMAKNPAPHLTCQHVMAAPESLYHTIAYQGGGVRRGLFYGWVMGQKLPVTNMYLILSQINYNDLWRQVDISPDYHRITYPIMHMGGWYDLYLRGNIEAFNGAQNKGGKGGKGKQRLVIGPWTHNNFAGITGLKMVELTYPSNARYDIGKAFNWMDECLNGRDRGFQKGPAVRYYTMGDPEDPKAPGNEWRTADAWPVPSKKTPYFFHTDGKLAPTKPNAAAASKRIVDDPANPVPTLGSRAHGDERHPVDLRPIQKRKDVLSFETPVLTAPVEVTGQITANIYFKTDVVDTDFNVRLVDIYPDGRAMLVTDGIARASQMKSDRYRVKLTPGKETKLTVDLWSTSLIFNKGHKIGIIISGTNFPRFDVNYHTGQFFDLSKEELETAMKTGVEAYTYKPDLPKDYKVANTDLLLSKQHPSHVVLPIVPLKK